MQITVQHQIIHNLLLIDESGSMQKLHHAVIDSINDTLLAIKNCERDQSSQSQRVSLFTFNGIGVKMHMFNKSCDEFGSMRYDQYNPNSTTPLMDCLGQAIGMVRTLSDRANTKVIVTIVTDGQENGSKKYCKKSIKELISLMKCAGWIFNYVGANHDVKKTCEGLNISNYYIFQNSPSDLKNQMYLERMARIKHCKTLTQAQCSERMIAA